VVLELKNRNLAMVELETKLPWLCVCARARSRVCQAFVRLATDGLSHGKAIRETVLYAGVEEPFC
jgi:hypothetical protein